MERRFVARHRMDDLQTVFFRKAEIDQRASDARVQVDERGRELRFRRV
jgi:hypothetical protein